MNVSSVSPLRWDTSSWHVLDSFSARCIQSSNKSSGHWLRSEPSHPNRWRHCPSMQWWLRWCYRSGSPSKEVHSLPATGVLLVKIQWKVQCFTFLGSPITRYLLFEFFLATSANESLTYHWLRWSGSHIIHQGALCSWAYWILFGFVTSLSEGRQMQDHATSYDRRDMQIRSLSFTVVASEAILEAVVTLLVLCHFMPLQPIMDQSLQNSNPSGGSTVLRFPAGRHQRSERFCPTLPLSRCMLPSHPAA